MFVEIVAREGSEPIPTLEEFCKIFGSGAPEILRVLWFGRETIEAAKDLVGA